MERTNNKRWFWISIVAVVPLLVLIRYLLEPEKPKFIDFSVPKSEFANLTELLDSEKIEFPEFLSKIHNKSIWIVGEEHFYNETIQFLLKLMSSVRERRVALLLELPNKNQSAIERYMQSGDEKEFDTIFDEYSLPYYQILRWAYANKERIQCVMAMDENPLHIFIMRLFLTDTRNETMSKAISDAHQKYSSAQIIAYGGSMHMLVSGRYLYDVVNRVPAGARLSKYDIRRSDVVSIILGGKDKFPLSPVIEGPWIIGTNNKFGNLHYKYVFETPIFGSEKIQVLFDFFVNVGPMTTCLDWSQLPSNNELNRPEK